jgi:hypothetical protein
MKTILIIAIVVACVVGLLFTLRTSRNVGTPSAAVVERAKQRERDQEAKDKT